MIEEAIDKIERMSIAVNRDEVIKIDDGSERRFMFRDDLKRYEWIDRVVVKTGGVSNIESFADLVIEEARRRNNVSGDNMTVTFSLLGARFSPDDEVRLDSFTYSRELAPQWKLLVSKLGKEMLHVDFVRLLQQLRPSIPDYAALLREFRKVTFGAKTGITSAPTIVEGRTGNAYEVAFEAQGSTGNTALPSEFDVSMRYARGSATTYPMKLEIDIRYDEPSKKLFFSLVAPDIANVEEAAIEDEIAFFRTRTDSLPNLLTLIDY